LTREDGTKRVHGRTKTARVSQRISRALPNLAPELPPPVIVRAAERDGYLFRGRGSLLRAQCQLSGASASTAHGRGPRREAGGRTMHLHPCPPQVGRGAESSRRRTVGRCGCVAVHPNVYVNTYLRPPRMDKSVDNLPFSGEVTIRRRCAGVCTESAAFTPSWPALHHFRRTRPCPSRRRLGRLYGQAHNRSLSRCRRPSIGCRGQCNSAGLP